VVALANALKYTNKLKLLKTGLDRRHIREEVRDVIYTQLVVENQSKEKTDVYKKIKRVGHGQLFLVLCLLILFSRFNFNFKFIR
jgi:hypothetical protein